MEKRLLSLLLALTLAFSLALPAFAEAAPAEQPGAEEPAEAEEPAAAEEPSGDVPAEEPAPGSVPELAEEPANPTPDPTEEPAQPTPEPTEGPEAPAEYTVTFHITVDGEKRDPIEKTFAPGAALALPEELKALKEAGYELAWYLDEALKEAVKPEEEPLFVTADLALYVVASLPAAEEPTPEPTPEEPKEPAPESGVPGMEQPGIEEPTSPAQPEQPEAEPTPGPSEEPEEEPTPAPTETPEEEPVPTEEPVEEPTPEPTPEEPKEPAPESGVPGMEQPGIEEPEEEPMPTPTEVPEEEPVPTEEPEEEPTPTPSEEPEEEPAPEAPEEPEAEPNGKTAAIDAGEVMPIAEAVTASGSCGAEGDNLTWKLTSDGVLTISGTGAMIDWYWSSNCPWYNYQSVIISVKILSGVTSIGESAFSGCDSLTSVTISSGVTSIGEYAFSGCDSLTSVTIPGSVTSVGESAFSHCTSLTSVTIPNSVTSIGEDSFYGCTSLTAINVDSGNKNYSSSDGVLFNKAKTLLVQYPNGKSGGYTVPSGVTTIGEEAFYDCDGLTSVKISGSMTSIGERAFYGCDSLTSVTISSGSVASIGSSAFSNCSNLTSVTISSGVTSIGESAFSHCTSLTSVTIPNSVTSIGDVAFSYCDSLKSVTISSGVTSIGYRAFSYCDNLTAINVASGNKNYCSVSGVLFNKAKTELIQYPAGKSGALYSIPGSVTSIGDYAFYNCWLTNVMIPASVTSIGDWAFYNHYSELVIYGEKGSYAETYAGKKGFSFQTAGTAVASGNCGAEGDNLTWKLTCDGVLTISGTGAMDYWISDRSSRPWQDYWYDITSVKILNGVTSIGSYAFSGCGSLTSVTIPASVTSIGEDSFYGCTSLTVINVDSGNKNYSSSDGVLFNKAKTLLVQYPNGKSGGYTIPSGVTSIGASAFCSCDNLTSVTIPSSVTSIGASAFYNCDSLTSVTIPGSVTSIGAEAFYDCDSLKSVTISSGVTNIGASAFYSCNNLTSVTISSGVTSIGESAFSGCDSLTSVTIPGSVTSIGDKAFSYCDNLTAINVASGNKNYCSVSGVLFNKVKTLLIQYPNGKSGGYTVPSGVTSIGESAFSGCDSLKSVTISSGVTSIGESAFSGCDSLTSVTIPKGVISIGSNAFCQCRNLRDAVSLPEGLKTLGGSAFYGCAFSSVYVPSSVTSIGSEALGYTKKTVSSKGHIWFVVDPDFIIRGKPGSAAETYAKENGIKFSAETAPAYPLPAPKLSSVENVNGGVKVTWGKVTGAAKYRVFYKPSGGSWAKAGDTTSTSYTWTGTKSGTTYQFRVWCISADGKTQTSTYDTIKSITYVAAPNYTLSTPSTGGIKLSWSKVAGASKYKVFYKTTGDWKTLTTTTGTSYTIKSPKAGTKYTFRVRCVNSAGAVISGYITDKTLTYQAPAKLPAPKLSKVENVNGGVKVTWGKVTGAAKYRVFYKPSGGSWAKAGDTTSTSYTWKGAKSGTTYQFRVWCISADGKTQTSTYDAVKSIKYIAAPKNVTVSNAASGVKVSWTKSAGAAKYRVFYKTSSGSWTKAGDTTSNTYTWKGAKSGTTYQFRVWCVSADGKTQTSAYDTIKTITYIAAPNYTLSTPSTGGIKLSWTKVTGASKYKVFYKTSGDWKTLTTTTATSYTIKSPKAGTKYTFRVRCVNSAGAVVSGYITDKTLTYKAPSKLPAPKLSSVENVNGGVKVTWGKVTGAEKYRMFYKPSGGSWTKAGDTISTSYTWTGAKSGTTYQFRVWCISADGKTQTSTYDGVKTITYIAAPNYTLSMLSTGGIKLSWTKVTGASRYQVYYKTIGDWKTLTTTTATSYTVNSPKAGTKYTFRVRCVDSAGAAVSGYIADKTITYKGAAYEEYREKVAKVEAAGIKVQKQLYRVTPEEPHTKIVGICNVCSALTLLNRRLALDGKSGQKFLLDDIFTALKCTNVKGPMEWADKTRGKTGYSFDGSTGTWWSATYRNSSGSKYTFVMKNAKTVESEMGSMTFEEYLAKLLRDHPEGICVRSNRASHVAVITDYEEINGKIQLYAQDPSSSYDGVWENSYLYIHGTNGKSFISGLDAISYIG